MLPTRLRTIFRENPADPGNELPLLEAARAVDRELKPDTTAKVELVNYVAALDFIDERQAAGTVAYNSAFLKKLHGVVSRGLGRARSYLISVSILNIGRYMLMMITPTIRPTPIIISGSMMEVSDWIAASTSSS